MRSPTGFISNVSLHDHTPETGCRPAGMSLLFSLVKDRFIAPELYFPRDILRAKLKSVQCVDCPLTIGVMVPASGSAGD